MLVCNLASGSAGNSTYVETKKYKILIDLGRTSKYVTEKLKEINVDAKDIDYVFLTHTHDDHTSAIKTFLKNKKTKLVLTRKMLNELNLDILDNFIIYEDNPDIDGLDVKSFKMSHDVSDSRGFLFAEGDSSFVYITDTGYINSRYLKELKGKNSYFIESNHDIEMLMHGPYPEYLKRRVLSDKGHLSNKFAGIYLSKLIDENTKNIVLMHLSEKNNNEDIALNTVTSALEDLNLNFNITCAKQNEISEVFEI